MLKVLEYCTGRRNFDIQKLVEKTSLRVCLAHFLGQKTCMNNVVQKQLNQRKGLPKIALELNDNYLSEEVNILKYKIAEIKPDDCGEKIGTVSGAV